jgi:hypothetical protein
VLINDFCLNAFTEDEFFIIGKDTVTPSDVSQVARLHICYGDPRMESSDFRYQSLFEWEGMSCSRVIWTRIPRVIAANSNRSNTSAMIFVPLFEEWPCFKPVSSLAGFYKRSVDRYLPSNSDAIRNLRIGFSGGMSNLTSQLDVKSACARAESLWLWRGLLGQRLPHSPKLVPSARIIK